MLIDKESNDIREKIKELCHKLFDQNYILEFVFAPNDVLRKANPDYTFLSLHFDCVAELLDQCGWKLNQNEEAGVFYLTSPYPSTKVTLNKTESYYLFGSRLLYDEKKMKASASGEIFATVQELFEKLSTLDVLNPVSRQERERALRTLQSKNIITRITGKWTDPDARIAIMPSILCAISSTRVKRLLESLTQDHQSEAPDGDDEEGSETGGETQN